MSLDLERHLAAHSEVLDAAAPAVNTPVAHHLPSDRRAPYRRGLAIAGAAAIVILVVLGSLILLAPLSGEPPAADEPATPTTQVTTTTTTIPPVDGVSVEGFVVSEVVEAGLVSDLRSEKPRGFPGLLRVIG